MSTTEVKGYSASVSKSGRWFVAQLENGGVAAQGRTEQDAISKLENKIERFDDKVKAHRKTRRQQTV